MTTPSPIEIFILRMPGWSLRLALAGTMATTLMTLPLIIAGPVLWVLASRYIRLTEMVVEELGQQCRTRRRLEEDQEGHAVMLAERDTRIKTLEADLTAARVSAGRTAERDGDPVYRRVGLSPSAPDWLVTAARTAYRRRLHPDVHPPHHRPQAHDKYIRAEEAFDRIGRLRA